MCFTQNFKILASVADQAGLSPNWSHMSEDRFSPDLAHMEVVSLFSSLSHLPYVLSLVPFVSIFLYHFGRQLQITEILLTMLNCY